MQVNFPLLTNIDNDNNASTPLFVAIIIGGSIGWLQQCPAWYVAT